MSHKHLLFFKDLVFKAVQAAGFDLPVQMIKLEQTKTLEHGHFSTNVAMLLAGSLKKNPRDVAQAIEVHLKHEILGKVEIAGPGFLNLFIEQKFYTNEAQSLSQNIQLYLKESFADQTKKTMLIDYSHPNIAKPMAAHHLLTTVIGESLKRIYRRLGWTVWADNFIGDMGTQFGKLMHAIKLWGSIEAIEKDPIKELQKLYVRFHEEAEDEEHPEKKEDFDAAGRAAYLKLEQGDPEARKMWTKIREWSLQEIQPVYDRLEVSFDEMNGESFYEDKMQPILEKGQKDGIIVEGNEGALIIPSDDPEGTPVLVRKSDGATIYATRDLARIKYWEDQWHPDVMVNVVDNAQSFHFQQVFYAAERLHLTKARNVHVSFGRMKFKDMKMSTRKGNIVLLNEVLDEAEARAVEEIQSREGDLSVSEKKELAKNMGLNSIKYNILSQNRQTDLQFEWDRMLSFEGNSAPYLMYTLARAKSIFRKAEKRLEEVAMFELDLILDIEKELIITLMMYPEVIRHAAEEFKPNLIANYLYNLASCFNSFYNGNPILKADSKSLEESRLLLTAAVVKVMEDGFELLGMRGVEKM